MEASFGCETNQSAQVQIVIGTLLKEQKEKPVTFQLTHQVLEDQVTGFTVFEYRKQPDHSVYNINMCDQVELSFHLHMNHH